MSSVSVRGSAMVSKAMPWVCSRAITSGLVAGTHQAAGNVTTVSGTWPSTGMRCVIGRPSQRISLPPDAGER